jgi:hypothetical protein
MKAPHPSPLNDEVDLEAGASIVSRRPVDKGQTPGEKWIETGSRISLLSGRVGSLSLELAGFPSPASVRPPCRVFAG